MARRMERPFHSRSGTTNSKCDKSVVFLQVDRTFLRDNLTGICVAPVVGERRRIRTPFARGPGGSGKWVCSHGWILYHDRH